MRGKGRKGDEPEEERGLSNMAGMRNDAKERVFLLEMAKQISAEGGIFDFFSYPVYNVIPLHLSKPSVKSSTYKRLVLI